MDTGQQIAAGLIAARAVHFGACLLALGVVAFDQLIAGPGLRGVSSDFWHLWSRSANRMLGLSLAFALISGAAWLALNAITMSGLSPSEALQPEVLKVVLSDTHFGKLWELRGILWIATIVALRGGFTTRLAGPLAGRSLPVQRALKPAPGLQVTRIEGSVLLVLTGSFAGSLAWAGHGADGISHLIADVVHLVIGAIWPVGLLPFLLLLNRLRKSDGAEKWNAIATITRRFSATSLACVILLSTTGLINSLYLVGSPSQLLTTDYGKALTAKLAIFLVMIGLGAINLLKCRPGLCAIPDARASLFAARLQRNVAIELALGAILFIAVGLLGILPPAIDAMAHHHHHQ